MIRVGDKYYHEGSDWLVVNVHYPTQSAGDIYHFVIENEGVQMRIPLALYYKEMYEQQKLRADRAEKRWEKLKEHFIKEKEQSLGILSWSRNDGMLELMEQLEEDGE